MIYYYKQCEYLNVCVCVWMSLLTRFNIVPLCQRNSAAYWETQLFTFLPSRWENQYHAHVCTLNIKLVSFRDAGRHSVFLLDRGRLAVFSLYGFLTASSPSECNEIQWLELPNCLATLRWQQNSGEVAVPKKALPLHSKLRYSNFASTAV